MNAYIVISIISIILGQIVGHLNKKLPPVVKEEITYNEFFKNIFKGFKIDILNTIILLILSNFLIYHIGNELRTFLFLFIISSLLIVFSIDYRFSLIPDECHIYIGIIALINIAFNISNWYSYILGAVIGGGIFLGLGYLAILIFKKEGMGFGDVKLMAALGLFFGIKDIVIISLLSFFIAAIVGVILILFKKTKMDSYMPFGPFIVISTIIIMFIGPDLVIYGYVALCTYISRIITDIVYNLR